jgi:squalene-hopene/tetraprenyl-beta-curcumene cyclase
MKTILLVLIGCALPACAADAKSWNPQAAAGYLDGRMGWWAAWPSAARDHDTFCISCHTTLPYALGRPALRGRLGEHEPSDNEKEFLANISKRVALWDEVQPFYPDGKNGDPKTAESRGTEAVLNALVLARYQSPEAKDAMRNMWALQLKTGEKRGSWTWLNFHNEPWEADDSAFWGATLAALAAGSAPEAVDAGGLGMLAEYLQREQGSQSTLNRAVALWASGKLPKLLKPDQREGMVQDILAKQREDGGWSASSLVMKDWKRRDGTPMDAGSDGYGTGLMVVALQQSGMASAKSAAAKGVAWLERNQDASGAWISTSMNKKRDPASDAGRFMTDAATAYSVLALAGQGLSPAN